MNSIKQIIVSAACMLFTMAVGYKYGFDIASSSWSASINSMFFIIFPLSKQQIILCRNFSTSFLLVLNLKFVTHSRKTYKTCFNNWYAHKNKSYTQLTSFSKKFRSLTSTSLSLSNTDRASFVYPHAYPLYFSFYKGHRSKWYLNSEMEGT